MQASFNNRFIKNYKKEPGVKPWLFFIKKTCSGQKIGVGYLTIINYFIKENHVTTDPIKTKN